MRYHLQTLEDRLKRVIVDVNGCWLWQGCLNQDGYGLLISGGKLVRAHRWFYEQIKRPILVGLESDHLCRVRCCVNPYHLEMVTHRVNLLRSTAPSAKHATQTHCVKGYLIDGKRGNGGRYCKICSRLASHRYYHERRPQVRVGLTVISDKEGTE